MAYSRENFKNKVEEHLTGALLEFCKARAARKNGQTRWVQHWETEVRTLLEHSLSAALLHGIRGFKDRRRAVNEVIASMRANEASFRRAATSIVRKDYGLKKLENELTSADIEEFWVQAESLIDAVLG
jgi:hypothetical protein